MFPASISSSFLCFQFVRSGKANVLNCSRAGQWTVSRVVYDIVRFYLGKNSEFRSSSYDCSSSSTLSSSLLFFLRIVNNSFFVRRLIVL